MSQLMQISTSGIITLEDIARNIPEDPVIIEAGAYIGNDTVRLSAAWPKGSVHAFEPVPELYRLLKIKTFLFRNIKTYRVALGNCDGKMEMNVSSGESNASSSLMAPKDHLVFHPNTNFSKKINVQVMTLDTWANKQKISYVDFLWLDLQGSEYSVLNASPRILNTVKAVYSEVSLVEIYKGTLLYSDFKKWMENHGFMVVKEDLRWEDAGNVLFVR